MAYEDYIPGQNQRGPAPGQELAGAISGLGKLFGLDPEQAARVRDHNATIQRDAEKERRVKRYGELMSKYAMGGGKGLTPEEVAEATGHRVWLTQGGIGATETEHLTGMTADPKTGYSMAYSEKMRIEKEKKDAKAAADADAAARREEITTRTAANKAITAQGKVDKGAEIASQRAYDRLSNIGGSLTPLLHDSAVDNFATRADLEGNLEPKTFAPGSTVATDRATYQAAVDKIIQENGGREPTSASATWDRYRVALSALNRHKDDYPSQQLKAGFVDSGGGLESAGYNADLNALKGHFKDTRALNASIAAISKKLRRRYGIDSTESNSLATRIVAQHLSDSGNAADEMAVQGDADEVASNLAAGKYRLGADPAVPGSGVLPRYIHIMERYIIPDSGDPPRVGVRYRTVDTRLIPSAAK
ncbi:hypothetical protein UFOVP1325_38 [uncultured Caudovirales phage]|uniref:Uncharacterized protein n=1 Tax=uncultured Caudovirales phage TaxID=2100421 RepID=A0A6J5SFR8_9CAUD|nr:hypothetical protein UFOVP1325_38 [uncultured Caudovirales phage]CAB4212774.1 hypothetical protein UFOVP1435_33 [uncultured Caudovirales phage]CAB5227964.1 hypothetical protein UFOVP1530_23 [uncultured Caudovirales phage]